MFNGISVSENISLILVFLEGLLSFFAPCVLPLIPVYISYLAGNGKIVNEDGTILYNRKKVFVNTLFFVIGISSTFFILGFSFSSLGIFFNKNKMLFSRIGGLMIIILGLIQIGIFDFKFLKNEKRLYLDINKYKMNPIVAFIMGFTFSFAWTPCVGPALSSVLILSSNANSAAVGNLYVLVYSLGFIIPFIILGLFTTQTLNFFKKNRNLMKYTIKIGGIILVIIGIMTFTGMFTNITKILAY
ncbi:MAG: cytochrome c biogenesis protein CcdA [Tissierellia bacterium]|nr:cytochrome c biogenesis protein CcdA [Tissierellia bacterium]MDD4781537.1 cytochrome c biogenesis protein CcdA [Tissierellia bacterium]